MSNPVYIKNWEELSKQESETHLLEINIDGGCGWIEPKNADKNSWSGRHYLSTHTFYDGNYKYSTELLQSCGFNVILSNWDEQREDLIEMGEE